MKKNMRPKILITGGAGFVGSHLVQHLISNGIDSVDLKLLVPRGESLKNLPKGKYTVIRGDIRNLDDVKIATKGVNVIYHLAALIVRKEYTRDDYFDVNVTGTENLINALDRKNFKKFVFFSSVAVFGLPICKGDMKNISEKSVKNPCEVYGESKIAAEKIVVSSKLPFAIIRPTSVYGPRDHSSFPSLIRSIKNHYFFIVGDGKNKIDYVYVKDLVRASRLAELNRKNSDYIIGGGAESMNEISKDICENTRSWIMPFSISKSLAIFLSRFTSFFHLPFYPNRVRAMTSDFYFDLSKAKREIGYEPEYTVKEGSEFTIKWMYDNKLI